MGFYSLIANLKHHQQLQIILGNSRNGLIIAHLCFKQMLPKRKRKTPLKFAGEVEFYLWEVGLCHLQDVS